MSTPFATVQFIERLAHRNALGLRFRDAQTGERVSAGLSVRVVLDHTDRTFPAVPTPSGAFTVRTIPGLRRWEIRSVDANGVEEVAEAVLVRPVPVRVEVRDQLHRYLPCLVNAILPVDGLIAPDLGSPPSSPPSTAQEVAVPLYSAPSRTVPAGVAVVRATLVQAADRQPAAYAALEVSREPGGAPVRGIADERGEIAVLFAYPPLPRQLGSPPGATTKRSLADTTWTVGLRAYLPRQAPGSLPEVDRLLDQRPAALTTTTSPTASVTQAEVIYGRECVLPSSTAHSELAVGP
jgi:hypothetical protein